VRQVRYSVAASLDGFIAGPNGEFDWIIMDPEIDFPAMYAGVSGIVMGRRSYQVSLAFSGPESPPPLPTYVYSRTLPEGERDGVTIANDAVPHVRALKQVDGKPLWLWGGGELFRELADRRPRVTAASRVGSIWVSDRGRAASPRSLVERRAGDTSRGHPSPSRAARSSGVPASSSQRCRIPGTQ
jgi:dihydrofolate reductase